MISTTSLTPSGTALCRGCGEAFEPKRKNQQRCKPGCGWTRPFRSTEAANQARTAMRAGPREFITIDGEGIKDPDTGEHKYVLISCGDKHFSYDGAALEFGEIMHFLWNCYLCAPRAIYVGFYLKYDWAQWVRSLPVDRAQALLSEEMIKKRSRRYKHLPPFAVTYGGWDFDYLYGRRFKLRPAWLPKYFAEDMDRHRGWNADKEVYEEWGCKGCDGCRCPWEWMWINDAGSYFQTTLLKAIDPNPEKNPNPVCTQEEYEIIKVGKDRRNHAEYDPAMIEYNQLECDITSRLMAQLAEGMREEGLRPGRDQWYGPGQLAQLWLRKIKAPTGAQVREATPEGALDAARMSYFGGWFEIFWHGPAKGTSYSYDINSAYPFIMSQLPCLLHGKWTYETDVEMRKADPATLLDGFQLIHATVEGKNQIVGAMLHRQKNQKILRPQKTRGWFWARELKAALDAGFVSRIGFHERWHYAPCSCPPPLAALRELYEGRLAMGKNTAQGKARKLIYNSCYGKFAQSVGQPVFGNPIYASATTAGCRAMCCEAIGSHPRKADALLAVATDSVTFDSPHTHLTLSEEQLGAWSLTEHENLSLFMPGVYWDDRTRERVETGKEGVFKSRGIAAKDLSKHLASLDAAWKRAERSGEWPAMQVIVSFQLTSPRQALAQGDWSRCGQVRDDRPRDISADPKDKRQALCPGRSIPYEMGKELMSLPYDGTFGDELRARNEREYGDHPDGPVIQLETEVFRD